MTTALFTQRYNNIVKMGGGRYILFALPKIAFGQYRTTKNSADSSV